MIDYFSIALTHGLIMVAAWRLLSRPELDEENASAQVVDRPWLKSQSGGQADSVADKAEVRGDA